MLPQARSAAMTRRNVFIMIAVLVSVDAFIIGVLLAVQVKWWVGVLVGASAGLLPLAIIGPGFAVMLWAMGWTKLADQFPSVGGPMPPEARVAPTFTLRGIPMSNVVAWSSDEDYLHIAPLIPVAPLAPKLSIPWAAVEFPGGIEGERKRGAGVKVAVSGLNMTVPIELVRDELELRRAISQQQGPAETPPA